MRTVFGQGIHHRIRHLALQKLRQTQHPYPEAERLRFEFLRIRLFA
jgi:hypothetical protein